jgi:hypothetical protein
MKLKSCMGSRCGFLRRRVEELLEYMGMEEQESFKLIRNWLLMAWLLSPISMGELRPFTAMSFSTMTGQSKHNSTD